MVKTKATNKKILTAKTLTFASLLSLSMMFSVVKVSAIGNYGEPGQSKLSPVSGITLANGTSTTMEFNGGLGASQKGYYDSIGTGRNSNKVFLTGYKGITWYSPVPIPGKAQDSQIVSYGQVRENTNSSGVKFKAKSKLNVNSLASGNVIYGKGITNTSMYYVGQNGEWRYMAYSSGGDSISNPYFPPDVTSNKTVGNYAYDDSPWNYNNGCPGGMSIWDNVDSGVFHQYKLDMIGRLRIQEPSMNLASSQNSYWARKLSLRSDPSVQSSVFVGTRNNGTYYRDVTLMDNNYKNLRVIKEVVKDKETGNIVGTYTRNSTDAGNFTPTISVLGTLGLNKQYTVTVDVINMSTTATISNPSLLDVGYGTQSVWNSNVADFSDNQHKRTINKDIVYAPKETKTFTWDFTVDNTFSNKARVTALINGIHHSNADNLDGNDDTESRTLRLR